MSLFTDLPLSPELQKAIKEMGFESPSPIQAQSIPKLLAKDGIDFMGLAGTGTGKTVAFSVPMLEKLDPSKKHVQSIILCPTRELAMQVSKQVTLLGKAKNLRAITIYGGAGYGDQISGIKSGCQIVVGTPGRVIDHIKKGTLKLKDVKIVILDEADEMVSMGFREELEFILQGVPKETSNTWLFSATMSPDVKRVADRYLKKPESVQLNRKTMLSDKLEQLYYVTREMNKPQILSKLVESADDFYGLVFCQTKLLVGDVANYLKDRGHRTACLHGDIDQRSREKTMQAFRDRKVKILVCTDVAARGIDVQDITHVMNYSIPRELDNYVHRIGRTARSGKSGIAMSLVTPNTRRLVERIERMTKSKMKEGTVPSNKDIGIKKVTALYDRFSRQSNVSRASELLNEEWRNLIADMKPEEIVGRLVGVFMPEILKEGPERVRLGGTANNRDDSAGGRRGDRPRGRRDSGGGSRGRGSRPSFKRREGERGAERGGRPSFRGHSSSRSSSSGGGDRRRSRPSAN